MPPPFQDRRDELARLLADPRHVALAESGSAAVLWSPQAGRTLWSSPVGAKLAVRSASTRARLERLVRDLAPSDGVRLERLRFGGGVRSERLTCVCRGVMLASGEGALLVVAAVPFPKRRHASIAAIVGTLAPTPPVNERRSPSAAAIDITSELTSDEAVGGGPIKPPAGQARPQPTTRFLWETDAAGVFKRVSADLARVVGEPAAAITGRSWRDLATLVADPHGAVAEALATRTTWSGRTVLWRIGLTATAVPVELAAAPLRDQDGSFAGFRGFGLCRSGAVVAAAFPADAPAVETALPPLAPEALDRPSSEALGLPDGSRADREGPAQTHQTHPDAAAPGEPASPESSGRPSGPPRPSRSPLTVNERDAFQEIAKALGARFAGDDEGRTPSRPARHVEPGSLALRDAAAPSEPVRLVPRANLAGHAKLLDRLPFGVLVVRDQLPAYANRTFLDLAAHETLASLAAAGLARILSGWRPSSVAESEEGEEPVLLRARTGETTPTKVRAVGVDWQGGPATLMTFRQSREPTLAQRLRALELDLELREAREAELTASLDAATDGVIILDERGRILSLSRSAEALFGYDQREVAGELFTVLLWPDSRADALAYFEALKSRGLASALNEGRDVVGRGRLGGGCPLFLTMGRMGVGARPKFCAVVRDMTAWKQVEAELLQARKAAERASAHKSDFLATMSHEIRTSLNAIIGFAEIMLDERFGPIGTQRYKEYLKDIHTSGGHVVSLVNDLLDLAKIEAGRMQLAFASVDLNDVVSNCVALMQPQASRERIVLRSSLAPKLPNVLADERSMRQVVLNVLSNAVKFTDAGGQVIVSTQPAEHDEVALRVRDTGVGMTDKEVEAALEPFRQLAAAHRAGSTGLGLPLAKALVEANRGSLAITSVKHEGTLIEIMIPRARAAP